LILSVSCTLTVSVPCAARLKAPGDVKIERYATGVKQPTNISFDSGGGLWVTSGGHATAPSDGVWYVPHSRAQPRHVVRALYSALGLTWHDGTLYVSHVTPYRTDAPRHFGRVMAYAGWDGKRFSHERVVLKGIPTGLHRVNSIVPGPDDRLYLGVGSQFDAQPSKRRLSGTVVSFDPDGRDLRVEARGLRNPYGVAFIPASDALLISDHGRDDLGPFRPHEEINLVHTAGRAPFFGFPVCHNQGGRDCRMSRVPLARLAPHSAPGAIAVAQEYGRYGPSAFVTEFGSSFSQNPTGGKVVRVRLFEVGGRVVGRVSRFVDGMERDHPLGAAIGPDGSLYVTRWSTGDILRISPRESSGSDSGRPLISILVSTLLPKQFGVDHLLLRLSATLRAIVVALASSPPPTKTP
jgi:glucose/arabinose dehydrogenase